MSTRHLLAALSSLVLLGGLVVAAPAELEAQRAGQQAFETRAELQERAEDIEVQLGGGDVSSDEERRLERELQRIRTRLEQGDFRPGDMVQVRVPGSDTLSGTFQVGPERGLRMSPVGRIGLEGVLYAEADSVVAAELRRFVRTDRGEIDVQPLQRVAVVGGVGSPGYYDVAPSATVSDVLMRAGGATQTSELDKIQIRRDGRTLAKAEEGELRESMTLAELGVERGDQIFVPQSGGGTGFGTIMSVVGAISTLTFAATRIF